MTTTRRQHHLKNNILFKRVRTRLPVKNHHRRVTTAARSTQISTATRYIQSSLMSVIPQLSGACKGWAERRQNGDLFDERFKDDVGFRFVMDVPQELPKIYSLSDIETVVRSESFAGDLISAIEQGFVDYSKGNFNACPIQTMGAPPMAPFAAASTENKENGNDDDYSAQTCVKSGYVTGDSNYIIKVASGGHPFSNNSGSLQIYSQQTGKLEALLLDEGILTELRTAAAGAVVAKYLGPRNVGCIGILGTGVQARYQLEYLRRVVDCQAVLIWGRDKKKAKKLMTEINRWKGWEATVASSADWLLELSDIIVTTTSSREVLLGKNRIPQKRTAMHITCIGSDSPGKMEISNDLIERAALLVADSRVQTQERGEFSRAIASDLVSVDDVMELGELVEKTELHRSVEFDNRLTIFDSSGVAVQDCVVAKLVYDKLKEQEAMKMEVE